MERLGMLSMGLFIGLLATRGTKFVDNYEHWKSISAAIIGSCLGGTAVTFMSLKLHSEDSKAIYMYLVGLLLSYCWNQSPILMDLVQGDGVHFWLGMSGIFGNVLLSCIAFVFVFPKVWADAKASRS